MTCWHPLVGGTKPVHGDHLPPFLLLSLCGNFLAAQPSIGQDRHFAQCSVHQFFGPPMCPLLPSDVCTNWELHSSYPASQNDRRNLQINIFTSRSNQNTCILAFSPYSHMSSSTTKYCGSKVRNLSKSFWRTSCDLELQQLCSLHHLQLGKCLTYTVPGSSF